MISLARFCTEESKMKIHSEHKRNIRIHPMRLRWERFETPASNNGDKLKPCIDTIPNESERLLRIFKQAGCYFNPGPPYRREIVCREL